jgi:hypothetical protein
MYVVTQWIPAQRFIVVGAVSCLLDELELFIVKPELRNVSHSGKIPKNQ